MRKVLKYVIFSTIPFDSIQFQEVKVGRVKVVVLYMQVRT